MSNNKQEELDKLYALYKNCLLCPLAFGGRTNVVFGTGNPDAKIMIIGEAPGATEDLLQIPFTGRSGKLLTECFKKVGIERDSMYITNIVKCRPPKNRTPVYQEISTCKKELLYKQIEIIAPSFICTVGSIPFSGLLGISKPISEARGKLFFYKNIPVLPIFHPAYILRKRELLPLFLEDLQKLSLLENNGI